MITRWIRPQWRLQWRLAVSYILVAVVGVLTFVAATALLTATNLQNRAKSDTAGFIDKAIVQSMEYDVAPYLAPYLEQSPPDVLDLTQQMSGITNPNSPLNAKSLLPAHSATGNPDVLVVLDRADAPIAVVGMGVDAVRSLIADAHVRAAVASVWAGARNSESQATQLKSEDAAAAALIDYDGRIIGVAIGMFSRAKVQAAAQATQSSEAQAVMSVLDQEIPGALLFFLGASVLGTITGIVVSRSLTRRLKRIAGAAHHWSTGDFQVSVQDLSTDEIGLLARDLNDMANQVRQLVVARQELAVLEERHRLARDLHDSVKQQLFAMTMLIGAARSQAQAQPEIVTTLREAEQVGTQAHQELTAMIHALRPLVLADKPFASALRDLVVSWSRSSGITADLHVPDDLELPPDVASAQVYVAREALANVVRHSDATSVQLEVRPEVDSLQVTIADNGHGFDIGADERSGLGLTNMRERMEALGGTLRLESGPAGTRVETVCPLRGGILALKKGEKA